MAWEQKGFAVVSEVRNENEVMPMVHAFCNAEWQAKSVEGECAKLPEQLRQGLKIVPASLHFEMHN